MSEDDGNGIEWLTDGWLERYIKSTPAPKCECGSETDRHSHWCPLDKGESK